MFLFHPWSFLLFRNLLDTREMNYWYASLGKEKQGKIRKREGTFVWSKLYKKAGHSVPKEPCTIKRNQSTAVCVVYKLLIMGGSVHATGFSVCTGICLPLRTPHPPKSPQLEGVRKARSMCQAHEKNSHPTTPKNPIWFRAGLEKDSFSWKHPPAGSLL